MAKWPVQNQTQQTQKHAEQEAGNEHLTWAGLF